MSISEDRGPCNERRSMERKGGVSAIPIWQTKRERRLFVLALIDLARQLVEEEEARQAETKPEAKGA
jgi:hypothetical protein